MGVCCSSIQEGTNPPALPLSPGVSGEPQNAFTSKYKILEELGTGISGAVYKCIEIDTGQPCAVKVIDRPKGWPAGAIPMEVKAMRRIGYHPNVVQLKDYFDTSQELYIVLELLEGGTLFHRIQKMHHYREGYAVKLVKNLLQGIKHIHEYNFIHGDLKSENLLLESNGGSYPTVVKVADFGMSIEGLGRKYCGTLSYIAPEVIKVYLQLQESFDYKRDMWSVGVITYNLLSGKMPFPEKNEEGEFNSVFDLILKNELKFDGDEWVIVSPEAKDFVRALLTSDPKDRLSAKEALEHAWITGQRADNLQEDEAIINVTLQEQTVLQNVEVKKEDERDIEIDFLRAEMNTNAVLPNKANKNESSEENG